MRGISFINENLYRKFGHVDECKKAVQVFMEANDIKIVILNPYQINHHYTIPHALLFDLQKAKIAMDYLIMYSNQDVDEFINMYPAKWILLKSYFSDVIFVEEKTNLIH